MELLEPSINTSLRDFFNKLCFSVPLSLREHLRDAADLYRIMVNSSRVDLQVGENVSIFPVYSNTNRSIAVGLS